MLMLAVALLVIFWDDHRVLAAVLITGAFADRGVTALSAPAAGEDQAALPWVRAWRSSSAIGPTLNGKPMSDSLKRLEARRRMLVLRSERLREELGDAFGEFEGPLRGRLIAPVSRHRRNFSPSILLSLAGLSFALLASYAPGPWATRGIVAFSLARRVLALIRSARIAASSDGDIIRLGRNVAQSGSALAWGARGPEFKSRHSDQLKQVLIEIRLFGFSFRYNHR